MKKMLITGYDSRRRRNRRIVTVMTVVLAGFALATTVAAAGYVASIPIDTVIRADEGSKTELASRDVPEEFLGQSCVVIADATNNVSTHPDNDFLVESGQSSVLLPDVERASGGTILGVGRLILGPTIVVSLIMGPDEVFSEGIVVVLECEEVVTTTTAPVETTTIPDEVLPTVVTTIPDEVLPTVVTTVPADPSTLPFTGSETEGLALVAVALGGTGILFLVATRGRRQD